MSQKDLDEVDGLISISKVLNLKTKEEVKNFIDKEYPLKHSDRLTRLCRLHYFKVMYNHLELLNTPWNNTELLLSSEKILNL